jgi:L-Ala-D/L-Glu epimerase
MQIEIEPFTVNKRFAVAISRGSFSVSRNLLVKVVEEGIEGWGEAAEFSLPLPSESGSLAAGAFPGGSAPGKLVQPYEVVLKDLEKSQELLASINPWSRHEAEAILKQNSIGSVARAAVDLALHDWAGKRVGQPVWKLYGLQTEPRPLTSVTIGINTSEGAQERVRQWLSLGTIGVFKVKLGADAGIAADKAMFDAVREVVPAGTPISVDANGGWNLADAIDMSRWLADLGVDHIEQPLPLGREGDLPKLYAATAIPILLDESAQSLMQVGHFKGYCHGINIKLMKCGGISEALRMIHAARALGLKVMLGCYSNTTLANTAAAHLGSLVDYVDLDSHLNLIDDPFVGASFTDGALVLNEQPGWGVTRA